MKSPRPLKSSRPEDWADVRFVFTDIDDTITTDGQLSSEVYVMLERLAQSGLHVIPVTGRPAGWCDMIARFWPVSAVVGENGAFYFRYDRQHRKMVQVFSDNADTRQQNRNKLEAIRSAVLKAIPGADVASDQDYRVSDLAIDFCEDIERLSDCDIDRIVSIFHEAGAIAKVSSIHVNGWFGAHTKASMTHEFMKREFNVDVDQPQSNTICTFVGDSPNDEEMFGMFVKSVGVANLNDLIERCQSLPSWITSKRSGAGFCEFADCLLAAKRASSVQ